MTHHFTIIKNMISTSHNSALRLKYSLEVSIHSIKIKLEEAEQIQVIIKRKKSEIIAEPKEYNKVSWETSIEELLTFDITMFCEQDKYYQKTLDFYIIVINGNTKFKIGHAVLEISEIAVSGNPIIKKNVPIENISDDEAFLSVSVAMSEINENKSNDSHIDLQCRAEESHILSAIKDFNRKFEFLQSIKMTSSMNNLLIHENAIENSSNSSRLTWSTLESDEFNIKLVDNQHLNNFKVDKENQALNPSELIESTHRKRFYSAEEFYHLSESSSSDEEPEIKYEVLDSKLPKRTMSEVYPNMQSKLEIIRQKERNSRVSSKRAGTCSRCITF
ncbi:unnamed protein product [Blepharisma stoltei]|uniref:C2 NT-type domain-containing protein n=1 Tax=Blepharisma stoltei TaxID=1481888 RepID=A0AAU9ID00_9CILI|nr:unnamed protein product [Blepharisma stoltei]